MDPVHAVGFVGEACGGVGVTPVEGGEGGDDGLDFDFCFCHCGGR